jgi:hypothetical protein
VKKIMEFPLIITSSGTTGTPAGTIEDSDTISGRSLRRKHHPIPAKVTAAIEATLPKTSESPEEDITNSKLNFARTLSPGGAAPTKTDAGLPMG